MLRRLIGRAAPHGANNGLSAATPADVSVDVAADVAELLAGLDAVPRNELPDGGARTHLATCIRVGLIDQVYRPQGADGHIIRWTTRQPWLDPRQPIADFMAGYGSYFTWVQAHNVEPVTPQEVAHDATQHARDDAE